MYHTANVLTATGSATPRYNVSITDTTTRFAIDGPVGDVNSAFTIDTALINGSGITSVAFWDGPVGTGTLLGTDSTPGDGFTWNATGLALGSHTLNAVATPGNIPANLATTVNVIAAPVASPIYRGCPGSQGEVVNNTLSGTTVATIEPGALGPGSGPVVVTTDLDFFSSVWGLGPNRRSPSTCSAG